MLTEVILKVVCIVVASQALKRILIERRELGVEVVDRLNSVVFADTHCEFKDSYR